MAKKQTTKQITEKSLEQKQSRWSGFSWSKLVYTVIVIFLYVPLVFVGVQTFLPNYADYNYPGQYKDCYAYIQYSQTDKCYNAQEQTAMVEKRDQCVADQQTEQKAYDDAKRQYDIWKYVSTLAVAVLTLVLVMLIAFDTPIKIGFFVGSAAAVFISTMQYFDTRSIPAFIVLVVVFALVVFVIQKREKFFG
ncbi:hypothetical protein HZA99_00940 [Candidatus Woesearchaeota archaeon]|nr:hypothetical protein [Candidatus Woesearchaeota archaeon]